MKYSNYFYSEMADTSLKSAQIVVPIVLEYIPVNSVVDVGCGMGAWLKVFLENGVKKVDGFDGDWVDRSKLCIKESFFTPVDFSGEFDIKARADLAVCLEVAEHLPHGQAKTLVKNLTSIAPIILFSAAIPFQGGSRHVNERWPEYWSDIFKQFGYLPIDCIRRKIWNNQDVSFFYAQNMFFYVSEQHLVQYPEVHLEYKNGNDVALPLIHPHMYLYYATRWRSLVPFIGKIPIPIIHFCKRILAKMSIRLQG